jgi:hypothetical protein
LRTASGRTKAGRATPELLMTAIFTILVFVAVVGALNFYEFGRLD